MKRITSLFSILLFMAILVVPSVIWGIKGITKSKAFEVEIEENRAPAEWPKKFSSDLPSEIENYYNDRVPFRSVMLNIYSICDGGAEGFYRESVQPVLVAMSGRKAEAVNTGLADLYNDKEIAKQEIPPAPQPKKVEPKSKEYKEIERKDPTCLDAGYVKYAKKDGSDEYTEELPALGHTYVDAGVAEPTYLKYGYHLYRCEVCGWEHKTDFTEKLIDDSYLPENIANHQVIIGRYNWLFYAGNYSKDYYTGANVMSEELMNIRMNKLKEVSDICEAQGKTIVFAIWPNKEQVYPEYMPTYQIENPVKREPAFAQYVSANSNVKFVYPVDDLTMGKVLGDTYFPYDTHWNTWGSFIGTMSIYKALGYPTPDLQDIQIAEVPSNSRGLVGTGLLNGEDYTEDFDYQVVYRPGVETVWTDGTRDLAAGYTDMYRAESREPLYDKNIVIIGDSFRVSTLPYLEKDFKRVAGASRPHMDWAAQDIKDADIIVMTAVERFDNELFAKLDELETYLTQ